MILFIHQIHRYLYDLSGKFSIDLLVVIRNVGLNIHLISAFLPQVQFRSDGFPNYQGKRLQVP
jgi:hypothetical protein